MLKGRFYLVLGLGVFLMSLPVYAHHNAATVYNLDESVEVSMTGTVTKMEWMNPHIHFYIDVTDASGNVVNYAVEGGTPNSLYRRGWRKDVLQPGMVVTVEGAAPSRNGSPRVHLGSVTVDGVQLFSGRN
jgi:hypothetical protein